MSEQNESLADIIANKRDSHHQGDPSPETATLERPTDNIPEGEHISEAFSNFADISEIQKNMGDRAEKSQKPVHPLEDFLRKQQENPEAEQPNLEEVEGTDTFIEFMRKKFESSEDMSPKAADRFNHIKEDRDNIKEDRDKYRDQNEELLKRIEALEAGNVLPKESVEEQTQEDQEVDGILPPVESEQELQPDNQEIEALQKELQALKEEREKDHERFEQVQKQLIAYDIQNDPDFIERHAKPLENSFNEIKDIVAASFPEDLGVAQDVVDKMANALVAKTDRDFHISMKSIMSEIPDEFKYQLSGVARDARKLYKEKNEAIANADETSLRLQNIKRTREKAQSEHVLTTFDQYKAQNDRSQEKMIEFFKSDQVKAATGFNYEDIVNRSAQESVDSIRNILTTQSVDENALKTVYKAAYSDVYLEALKIYSNEYKKLQDQYQEVVGSLKSQKESGTSGGITENSKPIDQQSAPESRPSGFVDYMKRVAPQLAEQKLYR